MLALYRNIKERRAALGLSQQELAEIVGYTDRSSIAKIESGKVDLTQSKIKAFAEALKTTSAELMGDVEKKPPTAINILPIPKMKKKPRLGAIACGEPILAVENIEEYDNVPENIICDFTLKCEGDSMIDARINDGDIVYIRQQPTVENGQIAAVLINDEATLKRVYLSDNAITLLACNPKYEPFVYSGKELEQIKIIGKAVGFTSVL